MTSTDKPTIVLVHGAWADASSFSAVTADLQRRGFTVLLAPNPLCGVANDTKEAADFVAQATSGPVVLVGHSYGGVVITGAAASLPEVRALVYVDAFAPAPGESASSLTNELPGSLLNVPDPTAIFDFVLPSPDAPQGDYDSYIKRERFHEVFAAGIPAHEAAGNACRPGHALLR
jgi:pimeloyl-ACP methyl ester carboxylesterase